MKSQSNPPLTLNGPLSFLLDRFGKDSDWAVVEINSRTWELRYENVSGKHSLDPRDIFVSVAQEYFNRTGVQMTVKTISFNLDTVWLVVQVPGPVSAVSGNGKITVLDFLRAEAKNNPAWVITVIGEDSWELQYIDNKHPKARTLEGAPDWHMAMSELSQKYFEMTGNRFVFTSNKASLFTHWIQLTVEYSDQIGAG